MWTEKSFLFRSLICFCKNLFHFFLSPAIIIFSASYLERGIWSQRKGDLQGEAVNTGALRSLSGGDVSLSGCEQLTPDWAAPSAPRGGSESAGRAAPLATARCHYRGKVQVQFSYWCSFVSDVTWRQNQLCKITIIQIYRSCHRIRISSIIIFNK